MFYSILNRARRFLPSPILTVPMQKLEICHYGGYPPCGVCVTILSSIKCFRSIDPVDVVSLVGSTAVALARLVLLLMSIVPFIFLIVVFAGSEKPLMSLYDHQERLMELNQQNPQPAVLRQDQILFLI